MKDEFVDLRRGHLNSDSFWPSFTDIMMVVVIIFLLTSMLLMVKNWELLDQLRTSMAAEEQAEKIILDTSQENATLEEQLAHAQNEISMLRMQLLQASEQANQLNVELEEKDRQIAEQKAKEKARKEKEAAIAREKYLNGLAGRENEIWEKIDALILTKKPKDYDEAIRHLIDLKDLAKKNNTTSLFKSKLMDIRENHSRKSSFIKRIDSASLL